MVHNAIYTCIHMYMYNSGEKITIFLPNEAGTLPNRSANQPENRVPNNVPKNEIICAVGTFLAY